MSRTTRAITITTGLVGPLTRGVHPESWIPTVGVHASAAECQLMIQQRIATTTTFACCCTNVNVATAENIAKAVKGIGYATAKKIVELRLSLPGERFKNLDQLKKISRVDWDTIIAEDLIYVA